MDCLKLRRSFLESPAWVRASPCTRLPSVAPAVDTEVMDCRRDWEACWRGPCWVRPRCGADVFLEGCTVKPARGDAVRPANLLFKLRCTVLVAYEECETE